MIVVAVIMIRRKGIIVTINPVNRRCFTRPFGEARGLSNVFVRKMWGLRHIMVVASFSSNKDILIKTTQGEYSTTKNWGY